MDSLLRKVLGITSFLLLAAVALVSCDSPLNTKTDSVTGRWYSIEQISQGAVAFQTYCEACHGNEAQGTQEWKKRDAAGNLPPPPLNGTAHAWHHSLILLDQVIAEGGALYGGVMPGFSAQLNASARLETIAYFQSLWNDEIYDTWQEINNQ
tara:strand:- start:660 stop:1115 length:456 start_codon:yes stop_codon:yes gene_type:complete